MSDIAIKVEGLGKKYKIGRKKSGSLRDSLANLFKKDISKPHLNDSTCLADRQAIQPASPAGGQFNLPRRQAGSSTIDATNEFWALKDINFEVKQGEAVGIIGRNGAGKSTLLKILSRITKPTTGRFEINGRVSSLLEVGTGFHMELTGRENIYLNGTILGMKRREIKEKFDEILAFSGVEEFIDTPVKHYSSGMKVRLAFSVAAHLEPEILIIDEVLAVGDAEFQKKCLGKMEDVTGQGRTVLFVSHNMGAVSKICTRGIALVDGTILYEGKTNEAIKLYLKNDQQSEDKQFLINIIYPNNSEKWERNELLTFELSFPKDISSALVVEMAAYSLNGTKVFNFKSEISSDSINKKLYIKVPNIGYAESPLSFDFGIKYPGETEYISLKPECFVVMPSTLSPNYRYFDVLTIPEIEIETK